MAPKRPHDGSNGSAGKRSKLVDLVRDAEPTPSSSDPQSTATSAQAQIAAARARVEAQLAAARAAGGQSQGQSQTQNQTARPSASSQPTRPTSVNSSAEIAAAKARIEAQMAAMKSGLRPSSTSTSNPASSSTTSNAPAGSNAKFDPSAIAKQVEEAKKRAMAAFGGLRPSSPSTSSSSSPLPSNAIKDSKSNTGIHPLLAGRGTIPNQKPTTSSSQQTSSTASSSESGVGIPTQSSIGDSQKVSYSHQFDKAPKFSSVSINNRKVETNLSKGGKDSKRQNIASSSTSIQANPYLSTALELSQDPENHVGVKNRSTHRGFQFHKPGRHVKEAEEQRREARMEELKRKIEESARKAGLSEEVGEGGVVGMRPNPPDVEWWDLNFLPQSKNYDEIQVEPLGTHHDQVENGKGKEKAKAGYQIPENSIDNLVQHPIPLPPPKSLCPEVQPRGLMLTKQEAKKLRRQRRAADLEDKRDRIKMGELPPDPPKVKLSNIVRVLASESVADPTKVEARVRREIAARKDQHERKNLENKLTKEEIQEKRKLKLEKEERKGTFTAVFKINHLVSPSHKFKVKKNAQQNHLTGITIFNPNFALVVVEGNFKSLKNYKHLMMNRIDWMDPGSKKTKDQEDEEDEEGDNYASSSRRKQNEDEDEISLEDVPWEENKCQLIFEGQIKERNFKGFRALKCPNDKAAKEALAGNVGGNKKGNSSSTTTTTTTTSGSANITGEMVGYWDVAKRWDTSLGDD